MLLIEYPRCSTCQKAKKWLLVKRPLIVMEDKVLVGFKPAEWETVLG